MKTKISIFPEKTALSHYAADFFVRTARAAIQKYGHFQVALSGGSTPMALYKLLSGVSLPWRKILFYWGDERCVPPTDAESCYNQARSVWLAFKPIPEKNIFRIQGELGPEAAAADYAKRLEAATGGKRRWPAFDLVLLGLGADGHTASLFPGSAETGDAPTVAVTAHYQDRPANRVSLTPAVFNDAHHIVFLAVGAEKAAALRETVCGERNPAQLPAQRICPLNGTLHWLVDEAAASQLPAQVEDVKIQRLPKE